MSNPYEQAFPDKSSTIAARDARAAARAAARDALQNPNNVSAVAVIQAAAVGAPGQLALPQDKSSDLIAALAELNINPTIPDVMDELSKFLNRTKLGGKSRRRRKRGGRSNKKKSKSNRRR